MAPGDSADGAGYLLKDRISDVEEFIGAVRRVAEGGSAIDPIIVDALLSEHRSDDPLAQLAARAGSAQKRSWPRAAPTRALPTSS